VKGFEDTQNSIKTEGCIIQARLLSSCLKILKMCQITNFNHVEFECELDQNDADGKEGIMLPLVLDETQEQDMIGFMESGKLVPNLTELLFSTSTNEGANINNVQVQVQIGNRAVHFPPVADISLHIHMGRTPPPLDPVVVVVQRVFKEIIRSL